MKNRFIIMTIILCICMASCGSNSANVDESEVYHILYGSEATTLNPFTSGTVTDWVATSPFSESLITSDEYGNLIPCLAESYTISEDGLVYTFKIRKGVKWVDCHGKVKGELTTKDFTCAAHFICDPKNASASTLYYKDIIKGASDLIAGNTTDFSTLGFKALDDYTLELTLEGPIPYFLSYCGSYGPAYEPLFTKLGSSYGVDNESIYFVGAYRLTTFDPQSKRVYEKNEHYWDKDKIHIKKIVATYNSEAATIAPELFLRGDIDACDIPFSILDEWMKDPRTKDIVIPSIPDTTYMYWYSFNYDPKFDEEYEPENYKKAVANENFRQSLYWGLNRQKAIRTFDPYNPEMFLTNTITGVTWCNVDGKDFTQIEPLKEISDRPNWCFNEQKALEYKAKAVEELKAQGVKFPVKLLMPYNPTTNGWDLEVQVVKQQLTELLGSDYIECIIEAGPSTGFLTSIRRAGKWGFMKLNNGGNIDDPKAWTVAFARGNNWTFLDKAEAKEITDITDNYYELVEQGINIFQKSIDRYEKFAEAEAMLINHALVIPYSADTTGYYVTKLSPMAKSSGNYKNRTILAEPLKSEVWKKYYEDWKIKREASLKK